MANKSRITRAHAGRPTLYTNELCDRICALLAEGMSLRTVLLTADDMPESSTVFGWLRLHEEFKLQYEAAKREAADAMAEEIQYLSDTVKTDKDSINKARLQVDTRKWLMSKMMPKKYGDKIDHTTNGKDLPTPLLSGASLIAISSDNINEEATTAS